MKKAFDFKLLALVAVLVMAALIPALAGISQGVGQTVGAVTPSGTIKDGNLPVWKNGTTIEDSGESFTGLVVRVDGAVQKSNGSATNLHVHGMIFDGGVTGIVSEVVFQGQTESQRKQYVGMTNEAVRNTSDDRFPVTVFDGSTTGGVGLVSWKGALVQVGEIYTANAVDWSGWTSNGSVTNGNLELDNGEYAISPVLENGIIDYESAVFAPGNGSSWTVTIYTNSTATPVDLPYYGQDARLRVDYGLTFPLIGGLYAGVSIPSTNGIVIHGIDRPDVLSYSGARIVPQSMITREPSNEKEMARLSTVLTYYTNAQDYANGQIVQYNRDTGKTVRGSKVLTANGWNFIPSGNSTNRVLDVSAGGIEMIRHEVGIGFCTINSISFTDSSTATILVSTNGVESAPALEWTGDLIFMQWQLPTVTSNSYPTAVGSNYVIQATIPDDDVGYYRAVQKDGASQMTLYADWITLPNLPTATNGLPSGTLWSDGGTLKVVP